MSRWVIWVDCCVSKYKLIDWLWSPLLVLIYKEECLRCRREQYRPRKDRETPEEVERRRHRNRKLLRCWRDAIPVEQRRFVRIRNVQVGTSTWDLVCVITHLLTWTSYLSWHASLEYPWDNFLHFEQQQRGNACFVIDKSWGCQW